MIEKKRTFGVLDTDRSPKLIEQGNYTYALNIRNSGSAGEQVGVIEPIRGSEKKEFNLPAGFNTCIGQYSHEEENHIYFFIHNASPNIIQHLIVRYDYGLSQFTKILQTAALNFRSQQHIVEADVINGQLFFNDAYNEPRRLDIQECIAFQSAQTWAFDATIAINGSGQVVLSTNNPLNLPPFSPGDHITIIREWREAWIDAYDAQTQGSATITIDTINGPGWLGGNSIQIDGVNQALTAYIQFDVGDEVQLAIEIANAINNNTPWTGPDFTAYVNPNNPLEVIVVAPEGTPDSYDGMPVVVNVSNPPGSSIPSAIIYGGTFSGIAAEDVGCATATYHYYDPNPSYSGVHTVVSVVGQTIILDTVPTEVQDELIFNGETSYIGGIAYLYDQNRRFNLPFQENFIKLYRPNPPFAPYSVYDSDESKKVNNLRGGLYQFKTRYVYPNGMRSVPSPISKIRTPQFEKNVAFQSTEVWRDNNIKVWFDTGGEDVVAIELLVRESSSVVSSDWSVAKTFNKESLGINSNTSHLYRFYGDEVRISLPVAEGTQPMDYIPHIGHAFCFIRDNRSAIGGCEEGFNNYEIEAKLEPVNCMPEDMPGPAIMFRKWGEDSGLYGGDVVTADLLPITRRVLFPLNKKPQVDDTNYISASFGPGAIAFEHCPFWRINKIEGSSPQYRFGLPDSPSFSFNSTWEYSTSNPRLLDYVPGDVSLGFNAANFWVGKLRSYPWLPVVFTLGLVDSGGFGIPDYPAVGTIFVLSLRFRVSKALVWCDRQNGQTPIDSAVYIENGGSDFDNLPGILGFESLNSSGQDGFYYLTKTFTKTVASNDTSETIRDYFMDEINNSEDLNKQLKVDFAIYNSPTGVGQIREATVNVGLQASITRGGVGEPTDWPLPEINTTTPTTANDFVPQFKNLWIRPTVEVVSVEGSENTISTFMPISRMSLIYEKIGANELKATADVINPESGMGFKTGANHLLAIEYRDSVGRRWTVSPTEIVYVPYFSEPTNFGRNNVALMARIYSKAAPRATHYQFMYAGNLSMFTWLQFEVNWVEFDSQSNVVKIALTPRLIRYNNAINAGETTGLTEIQGRSEISYSWTRGDRMRIMSFWVGNQADEEGSDATQDSPATQFVDIEIIGEATDEELGVVVMVNSQSILPYINVDSFGSGSLVEVYTPKDNVSADQLVYREIGETFKVTPNRNHYGNRLNQGDQTPGSNNPYAEVIIRGGDAYTIARSKMPVEGVNRSKDRTVESPWFSDFYPSQTWGGGASNLYDPEAKRMLRKDLIRYSDFLAGKNNGLNRYYDGNVSDEPDVTRGLIQRMECPDTNLYVFQELNTGLIPIRALELLSASGESVLMRSDNVLGNISYLPGSFGIGEHREALTYWAGIFYYPAVKSGKYIRVAGTQIQPISELGMDNFWNDLFEKMGRTGFSKIRIISEFDPKHGELIVHVSPFVTVNPFAYSEPVTIAYSEQKKGWVTRYSFEPEVLGRHRNKLVSWKQGQLYLHDSNENWNQFYEGEDPQRSKITLSFNSEIDAVKFLQSILVECTREPDEIEIETDYGAGQITGLFKDDFRYSENQYSAAILRDENSPGGILSGDVMRGESCLVTVEFDPTDRFKLFSVNLRYQKSEMTDR